MPRKIIERARAEGMAKTWSNITDVIEVKRYDLVTTKGNRKMMLFLALLKMVA